jgi:tetratricopeptide (TPR) repeat protein
MTDHYTDEDLLREDVQEHINACDACRVRHIEVVEFERALSDPLAWSIADSLTDTVASAPSPLRQRIEALDRSADRTHELLMPIMVSLAAFKQAEIERLQVYRSPEVVRALCAAAKGVRDTQPQLALAMATAAEEIASKLSSPGLVAASSLERAIAFVVLARYREADSALVRAEHGYLNDAGATEWDFANVWLTQANVCVETDRSDKALELAERAAEAYVNFGDRTRASRALLVRGGVLYLRGDYAAGLRVYEEFMACLATGPSKGEADILTRARATQGLGNCYAGLRQHAKAIELLSEALALWDELGADTERIRTTWSLAGVEVAQGNFDIGIRQLEDVVRQFGGLGVQNDCALARLELAEALLAAGRPDEVGTVLRDVAISFASEGMMRNARFALAYLHEAMTSGRLTASGVRYVRGYLEHLPTSNSERFQAPA